MKKLFFKQFNIFSRIKDLLVKADKLSVSPKHNEHKL